LHLSGNSPTIKLEDNVGADYYNPKIEFFSSVEGGTLEYISNPNFNGMQLHYRSTALNKDTFLRLQYNLAEFSSNITGGTTLKTDGVLQVNGSNNSYFSNGNVGIGTTAPTAPLHIKGGATSEVLKIEANANPYIRWVENGTNVGFLQFDGVNAYLSNMSNGSLLFRTNNTDKMTITSGGNVGIGTTNPNTSLHIDASATPTNNVPLKIESAAATSFMHFRDANTTADFKVRLGSSGDNLLMYAGGSERMRISSSGNVGIGTTSPGKKLDVNGDTILRGELVIDGDSSVNSRIKQTSSYLEIVGNNTDSADGARMWIGTGQTDQGFYINALNHFFRDTSSNTKMVINSSGNVGIGTTSPAAKLDVISGYNNGVRISGQGNVNNWMDIKILNYVTQAQAASFTDCNHIYTTNPTSGTAFPFTEYGALVIEGRDDASNTGIALRTGDGSGQQTRLAILGNGNVGIGTTSPSHRLHVVGANNDPIIRAVRGNNTAQYLDIRGYQILSQGNHLLLTADDTKEIWLGQESNTQRMTIDSNGNVGIGTTSPTAKLHVSGSQQFILIESTANSDATYRSKTTLGYYGSGTGIGSATNCWNVYDFNAGSERMRISSSGNVGIGTTSPGQKLSVAPSTDVSGEFGYAHVGNVGYNGYAGFSHVNRNSQGNYALLQESSGTTFLNASSGQSIRFRINNSEKMILDSSGRFGIGTTSPNQKLTIKGTDQYVAAEQTNYVWGGTTTIGVRMGTDATAGLLDFRRWTGTNTTHGTALITQVNSDGGYGLDFRVDNKSTNTLATTSRMFLSTSGEVGIGTRVPLENLHVYNGSAYITPIAYAASQNDWVIRTGAYNSTGFDQGLKIKSTSTGTSYMAFETAHSGGETMVLRSGNVGIGTDNPSQELHVVGNALISGGVYLSNTSISINNFYTNLDAQVSTGSLLVRNGFNYRPVSASAFNVTSDYRLKSNIEPLENATSRLKQLEVHRFNWIDRLDEPKVDGFIAHEVSSIVPEAVLGEKDGVYEDGTPKHQGIDQAKLVPLLTAALQEAIIKIENLESRIQTLENQ